MSMASISSTSPTDLSGHNVSIPSSSNDKLDIVWFRVMRFVLFHLSGLYGLYVIFTSAYLATTIFAFVLHVAGMIGVTAGIHRLWSHQAYKANLPLRVILVFFFTLTAQSSVFCWARNHRIHHKYSETNADPHNAKRGFFFSHCGWLMVRSHPDFKNKIKQIDVSDLLADPLVMFQHKYYKWLNVLLLVIPPLLAVYYWGETLSNAWHIVTVLRLIATYHSTFLINSVSHLWGNRPYDKFINPTQNLGVGIFAFGEGWHNYHHVFPWDYKAAELGNYSTNIATMFIDFFAWIGWASNLRTASADLVAARVKRTGDGTHDVWGWNDKDLTQEEKWKATIINGKKSRS